MTLRKTTDNIPDVRRRRKGLITVAVLLVLWVVYFVSEIEHEEKLPAVPDSLMDSVTQADLLVPQSPFVDEVQIYHVKEKKSRLGK